MYALNTKKGTTIHNDDIGDLVGGIAIPINERQSLIAKHLLGVVVFDSVAGIIEEQKHEVPRPKLPKGLYGINIKTMKVES